MDLVLAQIEDVLVHDLVGPGVGGEASHLVLQINPMLTGQARIGRIAGLGRCPQRMIAMAKQSKYRNEDHIKWSPLYIDFLMEWARENAL